MAADNQRLDEIRKKRIATLVGSYEFMQARFREIRENTHLAKTLVASAVEDYLRDRQALCNRNNITGRIQRHKIAGMMAAAIMKNRPIQLVEESTSAGISKDNEYLSIYHGLAICAEGKTADSIKKILSSPAIHIWFEETVYYLHRQPSQTEGFIAIFLTLSVAYFPENLDPHMENPPAAQEILPVKKAEGGFTATGKEVRV